jgi:hypothetical protein
MGSHCYEAGRALGWEATLARVFTRFRALARQRLTLHGRDAAASAPAASLRSYINRCGLDELQLHHIIQPVVGRILSSLSGLGFQA